MRHRKPLIALIAALALCDGTLWAQDADDGNDADDLDDVTMTVISEDAEQPDIVTKEIELPRDDQGEYIPSQHGVDSSRTGIETANRAHEDGHAFGQEARALAEDNRERFGRGGEGPDREELLPDGAPGAPEVPERPEQPGSP